MTTVEVLCRHFSRMGARVKITDASARQREKVRIDVGTDRDGEFFDVRCREGFVPEIIDVQPAARHLVLMFRDGPAKNKFLLGHDERHWFAAAVPGQSVRDVRTAMESLRPAEAADGGVVRQGEWFFVPVPGGNFSPVLRNEPLSRGGGSKPHMCEELARLFGETVMVSRGYATGISLKRYERLMATDPNARRMQWQRMVRDARVYVRGKVRHPDHKTVRLDGWHRVHMNRERFAPHATQIAFLD